IRVLAPGNDRHRDWSLLREVARRNPDFEVVVMSRRRAARQLVTPDVPNFSVRVPGGTKDLIQGYDRADVVAVPLRQNMHASGITVALESVYSGRPLAITGVGGVTDYLQDAAAYAQPGDPDSLAEAIRAAATRTGDESWLSDARDAVSGRGLTARDYG
ncbi:glycosyltransferase family 4 protein, partial [Klebsiella pneumoniae]|uniref:glycosyltransferase n=1 Tax=Klebsiella pneumoniae TaxID=573 RepID=UPI002006A43F